VKTRTRLLGVVAAASIAGALLLTTVGTAGSTGPVYAQTGTLDLVANDTDGDFFQFVPDDPTAAVLVETLGANSQGRISESGDDLTTLIPTGPGSGGQLYVGLKDHQIGVKAQGEGNGTPVALINDSGDNGQTLEIVLGPDTPGDYFWYAQVSLKFKFGATVRLQAYNGATPVGLPDVVVCDGTDCGADAGSDRLRLEVGNGDSTTLFTSVIISIDAPSDGAAGVIDDPTAMAAGEFLDTYFEVVEEFDGELPCDETASELGDGLSAEFIRLNTIGDVAVGCDTLKVYNLGLVAGQEIQFEPNAGVVAAYRGDLRFPAGTPTNPLTDVLFYDRDGGGPDGFVPTQWCNLLTVTPGDTWHQYPSDHPTHANQPYFPELAGLGASGEDLFPTLAGLPNDSDGKTPTSCNVAFETVGGGQKHWTEYLEGDPFYK
jgi:hypothetical protein